MKDEFIHWFSRKILLFVWWRVVLACAKTFIQVLLSRIIVSSTLMTRFQFWLSIVLAHLNRCSRHSSGKSGLDNDIMCNGSLISTRRRRTVLWFTSTFCCCKSWYISFVVISSALFVTSTIKSSWASLVLRGQRGLVLFNSVLSVFPSFKPYFNCTRWVSDDIWDFFLTPNSAPCLYFDENAISNCLWIRQDMRSDLVLLKWIIS